MRQSLLVLCLLAIPASSLAQQVPSICANAPMIEADVVALDQVYFWNRYGAFEPQGMIYALERDVVPILSSGSDVLLPGLVMLRPDKRPRPLVLRMYVGGCLRIHFRNLLATGPKDKEQPSTRAASIHAIGLQLVGSLDDDGSFVGANAANGIIDPGQSITYTLYAEREGTHLIHSMGAIVGGEGDSGSISPGLFGAIHVEPAGSKWYRSQVTNADLRLATLPLGIPGGHPRIDYSAVYPTGHKYAGLPILDILQGNEIVHSELSAIITGPNGGNFQNYPFTTTPTYPNRAQPFRENTVIFHDEVGAVQAFPHFYDRDLAHTLHGGRDAFAINYGAAGIGAEVLANRLEVGPAFDCAECKYEEFFLSSWVVGDPAMVVDHPANEPCLSTPNFRDGANCSPTEGRKATIAHYPADPSNVFHSYLNDHVKIRNLHAGSDDHHVFHLHAHQWLHSPRSDNSSYLDSQTIGQGAAFTYEIAHGGSGNINETVGDSIFHCHFYPHFAQGMWGLWRVHDVLERGTELGNDGKPAIGSRALPDNEILTGTPIPAVVPIPSLPMAPLPGPVTINHLTGQIQLPSTVTVNPGYPFFVPGKMGRRAPQPPLDTIDDGGLPRHRVLNGTSDHEETRLSFRKELETLAVEWLDEPGEPEELVAMNFHAQSGVATPTPLGGSGTFKLNGRPPAPGAPYADPCPAPTASSPRRYKAADIQLDTILNKKRWHSPQQRITSLWEDVDDYLFGPLAFRKPPEPLFIRANSGDCIEYQLTNLVPNEYHLDDFQVRSPTDILGQHIHLVKFDVTSSDGAANGWNYEDGSFSPEEVQERICAIRIANGCEPAIGVDGECTFAGPASLTCPVPEVHPRFQNLNHDVDCDDHPDWLGAQTTVQRWWADPLVSSGDGSDRTIRTVFTHDHFGPSTHQQVGLYGALVIEPPGSAWYHNETGVQLGVNRTDGGPTSWQAVIEGDSREDNYREFMIGFADFQLAYEPGSPVCPDLSPGGLGFADPDRAINPAGRKLVGPPLLYQKPDACPQEDDIEPFFLNVQAPQAPCPEIVSADDPGMAAVNYRNEPVALRVKKPGLLEQADGQAGDLSFAYSSLVDRADNDLDLQPPFYRPLTGDMQSGDPWTPMMRALEGDRVHVRIVVGAHEEEHNFTVHGLKWLAEPDFNNSGWRNSQGMGISEWFDIVIPRVPSLLGNGERADYLYKPSAAAEWQWDGLWGLLRLYRLAETDTESSLPAPVQKLDLRNPDGRADDVPFLDVDPKQEPVVARVDGRTEAENDKVKVSCPNNRPIRDYHVVAVAAAEALPDEAAGLDGLVYNRRATLVQTGGTEFDPPGEPAQRSGPLWDPTAIVFVRYEDLNWTHGRPRMKPLIRREPLVLRANAGECLRVQLTNKLPEDYADRPGWSAVPMIIEGFNNNDVAPSQEVGLHPQLLFTDIRRSDGTNVGLNGLHLAKQTVAPNESIVYYWYAGHVADTGQPTPATTPIEFGATGLSSSDPIKHSNKGAIGALVIEPENSTWVEDMILESDGVTRLSHASATINPGSPDPLRFREFVLLFQDNVNLRYADGAAVESLAVNEDAQESGQKAINYRTDPIWYRIGDAPDTSMEDRRAFPDYDQVLHNSFIGNQDPETPVFRTAANRAFRFRVVHPAGHTQMHVFDLHAHIWEELPYTLVSTRLGTNALSEWQGARGGHGASNHFDVLPKHGGGGAAGIAGDYLYRDYPPHFLDDGIWGLLRLLPVED